MLARVGDFFSLDVHPAFTLLSFTAVIVIYALFIYYFYRLLGKRNIVEFNLRKYNTYQGETWARFFSVFFYILEYIILLPIVTIFWFSVLSISVLLLASSLELKMVLFISAALVSSVRIISYLSSDMAKDVAKLLPLTLLAIAITQPGNFSVSTLIARFMEIPSLFSNILFYLVFIFCVELAMRLLELFMGDIDAFSEN